MERTSKCWAPKNKHSPVSLKTAVVAGRRFPRTTPCAATFVAPWAGDARQKDTGANPKAGFGDLGFLVFVCSGCTVYNSGDVMILGL